MRKNTILLAMLAMASALWATSCTEELDPGIADPGTDIVFGASTGWENDIRTRTEYSGKDENNAGISKGSGYERIDWVESMDRFRVLCEAATGKAVPTKKTADYVVSGVKVGTEKQKSEAEAVSCDDNALQWGTGEHVFYAMYPAPGMGSTYNFNYKYVTEENAKIESVTGNKAKITGVIPANQEYWKSGKEYKPNMNYAYMYATETTSTGPVSLSFKPLVTAFEVTVKAGDTEAVGMKLKSVAIVSEAGTNGTDLSGNFSATISPDGTYEVQKSGTSRSIKVSVAAADQLTLATGDALKFTLLALPVKQTHLSLVLTFDKSGTEVTRKLALRTDTDEDGTLGEEEWITVEAGRKIYISNLGVPGDVWTYTLSDVEDIVVNGRAAGSGVSKISSYRESTGSDAQYVPLTFQYSADGTNYQNGLPTGLTGFTQSDGSVAIEKKLTASVGAHNEILEHTQKNEIVEHARIMATRAAKGSAASPYDLSMHTLTGQTRTSPVTANSYVVTAPGTYMFPLVYGNAIDGSKVSNIDAMAVNGGNRAAYQASNTASPFTAYTRFDGSTIKRPYILWDIANGGVTVDDVHVGDHDNNYLWSNYEMVVLWQDVPMDEAIITAQPTVYQGASPLGRDVIYAVFTIDPTVIDEANFKVKGAHQGNIVIGLRVKNSSGISVNGTNWPAGTIIWSWHIWVTDRDVAPIRVKTASGSVRSYNDMLPLHLGWCDEKVYNVTRYKTRTWFVKATQTSHADGEEPLSTVFKVIQNGDNTYEQIRYSAATCYQWGRKDPLLPGYNTWSGGSFGDYTPPEEFHSYNKPWSSPAGYNIVGTEEGFLPVSNGEMSIPQMIRSPYLYNQLGVNYRNLWNASATDQWGDDKIVVKTIYDPCPPGYSLPHMWAFSYFNKRGTAAIVNGTHELDQINAMDVTGDGEITADDFKKDDGWYLYTGYGDNTIFFPGTTGRLSNQSYIRYFHEGYIWTAARDFREETSPAGKQNGGFDFHYTSTCAFPWISATNHALTVRPVAE